MKRIVWISIITVFMGVACSSKKMSERDKFLQEQQQGMDIKKGELNLVAGEYEGTLNSTDGLVHNIKLILQVKDVPETQQGTDPILVPRLLGSLRFVLGNEDLGETIECAIKTSEYLKARNQISIVATHAQFSELVLSGVVDGNQITGTWNAASVGRAGSFKVSRK
jgi:hypothetical protein